MKRLRLSTLLLLVVIASLIMALMVQDRMSARREAELNAKIKQLKYINDIIELEEMRDRRLRQYRPDPAVEERPAIEPMEIIERGKR